MSPDFGGTFLGVAAVFGVIVAVIGLIQKRTPLKILLVTLGSLAVIVVVTMVVVNGSRWFGGHTALAATTAWTATPATSVSTMTPVPGTVLLHQAAPDCANPPGVVWQPVHGAAGNSLTCAGGALVMQMGQQYYPEVDLASVGSTPYDDSNLGVQVQVSFSAGSAGTFAAILMQTPTDPHVCGGMLFEIDATGDWRLQQTESTCQMVNIAQGNVAAASAYTLTVQVRLGQLTGWINSTAITTTPDQLQGDITGLILLDTTWPSAAVSFTDYSVTQLG